MSETTYTYDTLSRCQQDWFDNKTVPSDSNDAIQYTCSRQNAAIKLINEGPISGDEIREVIDSMVRFCSEQCTQKC